MRNSPSAREIYQLLAIALLILVAAVLTTAKLTRISATEDLQQTAIDSLSVYAGNLSSELDKYQVIPRLLAQHTVLVDFLLNPADDELRKSANQLLADSNLKSRAMDTYVLNTEGITLSASNWNLENTFVGEDLSFRPYFRDAVETGTGYYFAVGSTSLKRGYYFSAAIYDTRTGISDVSDELIGVLVVKINLDKMENAWSQVSDVVAVTDEDGVIFISSNQDWVYRTVRPVPEDKINAIKTSRRYADNPLVPLEFTSITSESQNIKLISYTSDKANNVSRTLLQESKSVPEKGWVIHIFSDYNVVSRHVAGSVIVAASVAATVLALFGMFYIKRLGRIQEAKIKQSAYAAMKREVKSRTEELAATQDNLIQAAKMAALGKMATSISHELSQPLSAMRAFADNAQEFIKRDNLQSANSNLDLIISMGERMGAIMQNLKTFAHKTTLRLEDVPLDNVIKETLTLMNPAIQSAGVDIHYEGISPNLRVQAEPVRLQQVFTNLLQNAIDAVKQSEQKNISITCHQSENTVAVSVADTGTGIAEDFKEKLFEPFSSTKNAGDGLGLGLSLSYGLVQEFNGTISAKNAPGQGAIFTVELQTIQSDIGVPA